MRSCHLPLSLLIITAPWLPTLAAEGQSAGIVPSFTDVTREAGLDYTHGIVVPDNPESFEDFKLHQYKIMAGGVAAGDYDGDGWVDLYVVLGDAGPNKLLRNDGQGGFRDVAAEAGVDFEGDGNGPVFADFDGDGNLDLFVGGVAGTEPILARNLGNGRFKIVTMESGVDISRNTFSSSLGDYDGDGDLDLFTSHWQLNVDGEPGVEHLWRNNGDGTFTDASESAAIAGAYDAVDIYTFGANFADVDGDARPDLLVAGDFTTSHVFLNRRDGSFRDAGDLVDLDDENAMGTAVGDYDNDGDLDWFVTSVFHGDEVPGNNTRYRFGSTGNRLYRNLGDGRFEDVSEGAGVRDGAWGWAACFADFNNDGWLDIFHVNGMGDTRSDWWQEEFRWFLDDRSRLFMSNGDGSFTERTPEAGLDDGDQGRGVVCFDYDRDGDIDIFVANNNQPPRLYRNELQAQSAGQTHFLEVRLQGRPPNSEGIGARVYAVTESGIQMRELQAGTNYLSQNPAEAHFGLGAIDSVSNLCIEWPGRRQPATHHRDILADQILVIAQPPVDSGRNARSASCGTDLLD